MSRKEKDLSDYCVLDTKPDQRLSQFERLTMVGGSELERALSWIARQFLSFSLNQNFGQIDLEAIRAAAAFYSSGRFAESPQSFFQMPSQLPALNEVKVHGLADGEVIDLSFESVYKVQFPGFSDQYDPSQRNSLVHARMWRHFEKPSATMIALHGWTMGDQRLNSLAFRPGYFYQRGMNVVLMELPFHGRRAMDSGTLFPSTNVIRTNEALGQVISDLRVLRQLVNPESAVPLGWVGLSLGAYVGALWSSLDKHDFAIPLVPMVSMADMAWEILSRDSDFRKLKKQGLTLDLLKTVYRVHSPMTYKPLVAKERMMIVGGIGDRMVPAKQVKWLHELWGEPAIHWFRGGHAAQFKRSKAFTKVSEFLNSLHLFRP